MSDRYTRFGRPIAIGTAVGATVSSGFMGLLVALGIFSNTGVFAGGGTEAGLYATCNTGTCAMLVREVVDCTATGGQASYAYCNWQEPADNNGSGVMVTKIALQFGDAPVDIGVDVTIGASATASGSIAVTDLTDITSGTGTVHTFIAGSGGVNPLIISESDYIRAVTLTDPTTDHTARLLVEWTEMITTTN